jgi:hypothetical protein
VVQRGVFADAACRGDVSVLTAVWSIVLVLGLTVGDIGAGMQLF